MKLFFRSLMLFIPLALGLLMMDGCHKEQFSTKGALSFSTDTLTFDTVFTTLGSTTQSFLIHNTQSKSLNISDIKLMQLAGTQFRIAIPPNAPGNEFKNIDIPAHDSLYVFVEVTINPNAANNPFIVTDKVQFITNGITQNVVLEAMGQNAYYHFSDSVKVNTIWPNDKPHIIVNRNGGLPILEIVQGAILTLLPKTQIYMGPSAIISVDGGLTALGHDWADSIKFQYIRTDYPGQPGQYLGITYSRAANINMDHVIIDQSTVGLSDEYVLDLIANGQITTSNLNTYSNSPAMQPTVTLDKVIIRNSSSTALSAICTKLTATNSLFSSCSGQMVLFGMGGTYKMNNCTLANSYSIYTSSQSPILAVVDKIYYLNNSSLPVGPFTTAVTVNNTIVGGNVAQNGNTLGFNISPSDPVVFNNCVLTENKDSFHTIQPADNGCVYIGDPQNLQPQLFKAPNQDNYMPDSGSVVIGKAVGPAGSSDLYDYLRPSPASIGAIEYHH